jgi:hypothetical protein
MKRLLLILMILTLAGNSQAQIGWTLAQCRKHFGHELSWPLDDDPTARTFGIKFHPHQERVRGFDGRLLYMGFDPDGTVGKIKWSKFGGEFSAEEMNRLLGRASAVYWRPVSVHNEYEDARWVGEQNGKIIFDAVEDNNEMGGWFLTITTRTS